MTRVPLTLGKHYLLIDSPISFYLIDNEENSVYRPSGVWQLDTWKLLPEKYQKDHPVYTLLIEYDESKLADGKEVLIRESDIDLGDGVAGVSGQAVMLTGINDSLLPISVSVSNFPDIQKVNVQNQPTEIAVNNIPDNQKVTVTNVPDVQKVSVQNNPTSIGVNNFPSVQKVNVQNNPTSIAVNNFPEIQNVKSIDMPKVFCSVKRSTGLVSTFAVLKSNLESIVNDGGTIDHLFFRAGNNRYVAISIAFTDGGVVEFIAYNSTTDKPTFTGSFVVGSAVDSDVISWFIYYH